MLLGAPDPLMLEAAQRVVAVLVHRLGGEVTITDDELVDVDLHDLDARLNVLNDPDAMSLSMSISYKPAGDDVTEAGAD